MPRGNFWEATFDPDWGGPTDTAYLTNLAGSSGLVMRRVVSDVGEAASVTWRRRDQIPRHFQKCDFQLEVEHSSISDCTFTDCRFKGSTWRDVKFSNCTFRGCDFSGMTLVRCQFMSDCSFAKNSASAELFRIDETAISASAFISGLQTNLDYLPNGVTAEYQLARFVGTKHKIAKAIYGATRNEANLEYFYEAYEQLVRCTLAHRVERYRFGQQPGERTPQWQFVVRSLPVRLEGWIVRLSGWFSDWGRSLVKACVFFLAVVLVFGAFHKVVKRVPQAALSIREHLLDTTGDRPGLEEREDEERAKHGDEVEFEADRHAHCGRRPDRCGRGDAADRVSLAEDDAGADKADTGDDLGRHAVVAAGEKLRCLRKQRRAQRYQSQRAYACGIAA